MVGHHRIQIAFGGISLGLGGFFAFMTYLLGTNSIVVQGVSQDVATLVFYVLLFVSIIQVLAGVLNIIASNR